MDEYKFQHPQLNDDSAFLFWFIKAHITDDDNKALMSLTGNGDKGIDAIITDRKSKNCYLIQGKYHSKGNLVTENRSDVTSFVSLVSIFYDKYPFEEFLKKTNAKVQAKLPGIYKNVANENYRLNLFYVTTGRISNPLKKDGYNTVKLAKNIDAQFIPFDNKKVLWLFNNYLEGAAPPVPILDLPLNSSECFHRYDDKTGIDSWICTMKGRELGELFNKAGIRLFSRNIRGFLGDTKINMSMKKTIEKEPENFWYFNNGATIICDKAEKRDEADKSFLVVSNPQVINGQQTTRVLAEAKKTDAEVLVRIMALPQEEGRGKIRYVIDQIVKATNWQNAISQADLKSNDPIQVKLEKDLKKYRYQYLRKRQAPKEVYWASSGEFILSIKKEDLAKIVCACKLNPDLVRLGRDKLFEDEIYNKIFPKRILIQQYLTFYWIYKILNSVQLSDQIKKTIKYYGKWHVLYQVWRELKNSLNTEGKRRKFVYAMEKRNSAIFNGHVYRPLENIVKKTFYSTRDFYYEWRKAYDKTIEVNDFFKKKNIFREHTTYIRSDKNKRRQSVDKYIEKFDQGIESVDIL